MKKKYNILAVLTLIGAIGVGLTGCGSPSTVNLNDYVIANVNGYDGYGTAYLSLDVDQIIDDYSHKLNKNAGNGILGADTPALAAELAFDMYDPFDLEYEAPEGVKNGDKIEVVWDVNPNAVKELQKFLDVKFKYSDFDLTVEGLEELREVDPFEGFVLEGYGLSGKASLDTYTDAEIEISEGETQTFDVDIPYTENVSNGDSIHVTLENDAEYFAKNYGIELTRTEADIVIENLDYIPTENIQEVFECVTEESLENAKAAILWNYRDYVGDMKAELVGMVLYYNEEADLESFSSNNPNNQLALVYHLDNGVYPGGWYAYIALNEDVVINYQTLEDGTIVKTTTGENWDALPDAFGNYRGEYITYWGGPEVPTCFEYNGLNYAGHKTLAECLEALDVNLIQGKDGSYWSEARSYDHRVVTNGLKDVVSEY